MTDEERELQKYYEDLIEMFASNGWKHFIKDVEDDITQLKDSVFHYGTMADNETNIWHFRGKIKVLQNYKDFEQNTKIAYDQFLEVVDNKDE